MITPLKTLLTLAALLATLAPACAASSPDVALAELPGWQSDSVQEAWPALLKSCSRLKSEASWARPCALAASLDGSDEAKVRRFLEDNFTARLLAAPDGSTDALVTGYFEPVFSGQRTADATYRFPLYALPGDLEKGKPYMTRKEIDGADVPFPGSTVIAWLKDDLDRYLAHVQGSCKIRLPDGTLISAVYAGKNTQPYVSIGKILVARGEVPAEKISMQAIREWASNHPDKLQELLWANPSYTFFMERPATEDGPPGAMNLGLTPQRSAAIDPDRVPFGTPIWLDTTLPEGDKAYRRLLLSQDKGAAIRGLRVDVYFGTGDQAGNIAGAMKQPGRVWVLSPNSAPPSDQ